MVFYYILSLSAAFPVCQGDFGGDLDVKFDGPNENSLGWSTHFANALSGSCNPSISLIYSPDLGALINTAQKNMTVTKHKAYNGPNDARVYRTQGRDGVCVKGAAELYARFLKGHLGHVFCDMLRNHRKFMCQTYREEMGAWIWNWDGKPFIYCAFSKLSF